MFTKEEQALAKSCYKAIKKIAERTEKKCPMCKGSRDITFTHETFYKHIQCPTCNGTGKVRWEWEPEVGESCLWGEAVLLITGVDDYILEVSGVKQICQVNINQVTPLLHWERIKKILERAGYTLSTFNTPTENENTYGVWTIKDEYLSRYGEGKTRQEAVMRAVIELSKRG